MCAFLDKSLGRPKNIGESSLLLALAHKEKTDKARFAEFYTKEIMTTLYYLWKKYELYMSDIVIYIEAEYNRKTNATYIRKKLFNFEKELKKIDKKETTIEKEEQYCISSEKPTKTTIFKKKTKEDMSTDLIEKRDTVKIQKIVEVEEEKITEKLSDKDFIDSKKTEGRPLVKNSLPVKPTAVKNSSVNQEESTKNNDNQNKEPPIKEIELVEVDVIGAGYDNIQEQCLAEREIREKLLYRKLSAKKKKKLKMRA